MSTPSSKTTVMTESPDLETERTWSSRGRPRMAVSTGKVTNRSTSGGDMPGDVDSTSTWTLVTSGKASMGMRRTDQAPKAMRMTTPTRTRALFRRELSMTRSTKPMLISDQGALAHLGLQQEAARCDDRLPLREALDDLDRAGEPFPGFHGPANEDPLPCLDENDGPAFVILDRLLGDDQSPALPAGRGRALDVHSRFQPAAGARDLDAAFDRAGRRVDDVADEDEPAMELLAGIGVRFQDDFAARFGGAEVLLHDVETGPERRRVDQAEEAGAELDGVARDDRALQDRAGERRPDGEQRHGHGLSVEGLDLGG